MRKAGFFQMENKYRVFSVLIITITCVAAGLFYFILAGKVGTIYVDNTEKAINDIKQTFLKHTVDNQIRRIRERREEEISRMEALVQETERKLHFIAENAPGQFVPVFEKTFDDDKWTAVLWDAGSEEVLFDPRGLLEGRSVSSLRGRGEEFAAHSMRSYAGYSAFFGVSRDYADGLVKKAIAREIHESTFPFDSYIWVNEVLNYEGGPDYAIRRVHPNLKETEGMFLSTEMKDIEGNLPYLEELEGVKKDGEIFFTYFFKKKSSDTISRKLTFARLYKDFNWIVALGIHMDDMQLYIDKTRSESHALILHLITLFIVVLVLLLILAYALIVVSEKWFHKRSMTALEEKVNRDPVSDALSRRAAEDALRSAFSRGVDDPANPAVVTFDIDDFKRINDTYGHDAGDRVLKRIATVIHNHIRSTDHLFRWGGDEFLLLYRGLRPENIMRVCQNLLNAVSADVHSFGGRHESVSLSMGITYFRETDSDYSDALKRADVALYRSKANGKNQANIEL